MSTDSQALTVSHALNRYRYLSPNCPHDDAFTGERSSHWSAEDSSERVFIYENSNDFPYQRAWNNPASTCHVLPTNLPYEGGTSVQQALQLWIQRNNADASLVSISVDDQFDAPLAFYTEQRSALELAVEDVSPSPSLPPAVQEELVEFSAGLDGVYPTEEAIQIARILSKAAVHHVAHPDITVDIDGELSFDLRLDDGRLVFAELGLDGRLDVGVYGPDNQMLNHDAEATCTYLLSILES